MKIEYREIPGWPDYLAGSDGAIYSTKFNKLRRLASATNDGGYLQVSPWQKGKPRSQLVHRFICQAFHGPPAERMTASHLDGKRTNNIPTNLCWESESDNNRRKVGHGTHNRGCHSPCAIFSETEILEIRRRLAEGESCSSIARSFSCNRAPISRIKNGKRYKVYSEETS